MLRMILPVIAALALSGCVTDIADSKPASLSQSQIGQIQTTVVRDFFDPASAQFRDIRAVDVTLNNGQQIRRVCGEVNGKNRLGGYVGYTWFGGQIVNGSFVKRDFAGACESY